MLRSENTKKTTDSPRQSIETAWTNDEPNTACVQAIPFGAPELESAIPDSPGDDCSWLKAFGIGALLRVWFCRVDGELEGDGNRSSAGGGEGAGSTAKRSM